MIHSRVVELLRNPSLIQINDLKIIDAEIQTKPYVQSIRALYLLGIHQFDQEKYQETLSKTAAYTTDKKILYQLINGKIEKNIPEAEEVIIEKNRIEEEEILPKQIIGNQEETSLEQTIQNHFEESADLSNNKIEKPNPVVVEGKLNRILFEGEENFLNEKPEKIDLELTRESGQIVIEKHSESEIAFQKEEVAGENSINAEENHPESKITQPKIPTENTVKTSDIKEKLRNNEDKTAEKSEVKKDESEIIQSQKLELNETDKENSDKTHEKSAEVNFHSESAFLPDVKLTANKTPEKMQEKKTSSYDKQQEEMRRLIEEVEQKMRAKRAQKNSEEKALIEEKSGNTETSFAENKDLEVKSSEQNKEITTRQDKVIAKKQEKVSEEKEVVETQNPNWKPMNFQGNKPDSLLDEEEQMAVEEKNPEEKPILEAHTEEIQKEEPKNEQTPVMDVSFFSDDVSEIKNAEKKFEKKVENEESNVPKFLNTWQSWLKINRTEKVDETAMIQNDEFESLDEKPSKNEETEEGEKEETKSKTIDKFIENEPKISKLKEENDFLVKDKGDDISHLMTETLANIYVEQRLYAKAINAYKILIQKHPDKKDYFKDKIKEVRDLKG